MIRIICIVSEFTVCFVHCSVLSSRGSSRIEGVSILHCDIYNYNRVDRDYAMISHILVCFRYLFTFAFLIQLFLAVNKWYWVLQAFGVKNSVTNCVCVLYSRCFTKKLLSFSVICASIKMYSQPSAAYPDGCLRTRTSYTSIVSFCLYFFFMNFYIKLVSVGDATLVYGKQVG